MKYALNILVFSYFYIYEPISSDRIKNRIVKPYVFRTHQALSNAVKHKALLQGGGGEGDVLLLIILFEDIL